MPLPKLKYIVAPSVDFMLKQSFPNTEEEDPSKFVLPMPLESTYYVEGL